MAEIAIRNSMIMTIKLTHLCDDHCVCVVVIGLFGRMYFARIYFQFIFDSVEPYIPKIEEIISTLPGEKFIILADVNARLPLWHYYHVDVRGEQIELPLTSFDLTADRANTPTFRLHSSASTIDWTLASRDALKFIRKWSVMEGWTTSDHNTILTCMAPQRSQQYQLIFPRYNIRMADWRKFRRRIVELQSQGRPNAEILSPEGVFSVIRATEVSDMDCDNSRSRLNYITLSNIYTLSISNIVK